MVINIIEYNDQDDMEKAQSAIRSLAEINHKPLLQLDCEKLGIRLGLPSLVQNPFLITLRKS